MELKDSLPAAAVKFAMAAVIGPPRIIKTKGTGIGQGSNGNFGSGNRGGNVRGQTRNFRGRHIGRPNDGSVGG